MLCADSNIRRPMRVWAQVKSGIVIAIRSAFAREPQPFGPDAGRVVEVTGTDAQVGYLVDRMGNVTPRDNRKGQIPEGQSACMEGPPVPAPMSGPLAIAVASTGVTPSKDPDHPANWPQNRAKKQEADDGTTDNPAA